MWRQDASLHPFPHELAKCQVVNRCLNLIFPICKMGVICRVLDWDYTEDFDSRRFTGSTLDWKTVHETELSQCLTPARTSSYIMCREVVRWSSQDWAVSFLWQCLSCMVL